MTDSDVENVDPNGSCVVSDNAQATKPTNHKILSSVTASDEQEKEELDNNIENKVAMNEALYSRLLLLTPHDLQTLAQQHGIGAAMSVDIARALVNLESHETTVAGRFGFFGLKPAFGSKVHCAALITPDPIPGDGDDDGGKKAAAAAAAEMAKNATAAAAADMAKEKEAKPSPLYLCYLSQGQFDYLNDPYSPINMPDMDDPQVKVLCDMCLFTWPTSDDPSPPPPPSRSPPASPISLIRRKRSHFT
jgi:hypothetical protein